MFAGGARTVLAVWLRLLSALGGANRAGAVAYRSKARRLASDARARMRRWGVRFELNLNDNVQRTFYYTGWYERAFLKFLQRELRPTDTYVDVGAHVGIHAAFAARLVPQGNVVAFEPAPDTSALLRRSLGDRPNVEVVAAGLDAQAGKIALRTNPKWHREDASTRSRFGTGELVCEAPVLRFDDWAGSLERMDIVKIDAEGAERDVLLGMSGSIQSLRPRLVAIEVYAPYLAAAGATEAEIIDFLVDLGYVRERTIGHNVIFRLRGTKTAPAVISPHRERHMLPMALKPALYPAAASLGLAAWFAKAAVLSDYNLIWRPLGVDWGVWMFIFPSCALIAWMAAVTVFAVGRKDRSRALAGFVPDCLTLTGRLLADRSVPRRRKLLLLLLIVYLVMPIDPIPDFIPIAGQLDDLLAIALVFRQLSRAGGEPLVRQHWPGPASSLRLVRRLAGA
jgi:FkbM family methyltransferase